MHERRHKMNKEPIVAITGDGSVHHQTAIIDKPNIPEASKSELKDMVDALDNAKPEVENELSVDEMVAKRYQKKKEKASAYVITEEMMEEEKERISKLNVLAVAQYRKSINKKIDDMYTTKQMIEMLESLQEKAASEDANFGREVAIENIMHDLDLVEKEEIEEFKENFDQNLSRLNTTLDYVAERELELQDVKKTSTYMNQCMLEILDEKTKVLNAQTDKKYKKIQHYYKNIREVYVNRDSLDFIKNQVSATIPYIQRVANELRKAAKNGGSSKSYTTSLQKNVSKVFCKVFKIEQMIVFEKHIRNIFEGEFANVELASFLFQYFIYIVYKNEIDRKKGYHKWIEAFVMNIIDMETDNYDLPKDKEAFDKEILACAKDLMKKIKL